MPKQKGQLLKAFPSANIIDITHEITPFDVGEAAFILKNGYQSFPEGTIHLAPITKGEKGQRPPFLLGILNGHYFITSDNGLLPLIASETDFQAFLLENTKDLSKEPFTEVVIPTCRKIADEYAPEEIGEPVNDLFKPTPLHPVVKDTAIRGTVIYIDHYGNAITNVTYQEMLKFKEFKHCRINLNNGEYFEELHQDYHEVPEGEKVCLFNSSGLLEIAINQGSAADLLGIEKDHLILIEFS